MSVWFNFSIYVLIFFNTITLALYRYDESEKQTQNLLVAGHIFTVAFLIEMIFKLIGLGPKAYVSESFNILDSIIVVVSIVDLVFLYAMPENESVAMSAFRGLRLLRVMKLARIWKAFKEILKRIQQSLIDVSSFSLLLFIFVFIFALLGMELFANILFYDLDGNMIMGKENIQETFARGEQLIEPRENFNNIFYAMVSIFIVVIGEEWHIISGVYIRASAENGSASRTIALMYFLILIVVGHTILLALFTALLLRNFESSMEEKERHIRRMNRKKMIKKISTMAVSR